MFKKAKLSTRITVMTTAFVLVSVMVVYLGFSLMFQRTLRNQTMKDLETAAVTFANLLSTRTDYARLPLPSMIEDRIKLTIMSRLLEGDLLVVDNSGTILASTSTHFYPGTPLSEPLLSQVMQVTRNGRVSSLRYWGAVSVIRQDNLIAGRVVTLANSAAARSAALPLRRMLLLSLLMVLTGSIMFAQYWSGRLAKPLLSLKSQVSRVADRFRAPGQSRTEGDELAELSQALSDMERRLAAKEELERRFLQNASHELKTPLMSIIGYAEGIKDGVFRPDEVEHSLGIIVEESQRLHSLVNDMLLLSRLESEKEPHRPREFELHELLQAAHDRMHGLAIQQNVNITVECPRGLPGYGDHDQLLQVLINLLSNAVQYANNQVTLVGGMDADMLTIEVADDGPGITPGQEQLVFDRFFKGSKGNHGLGLAIAKAIVERHGGSIEAHNASTGAVFAVRLPVRPNQPGQ